MLGISHGTLQNLRIKNILPHRKIGGLMYYKYQDILKLLKGGEEKTTIYGKAAWATFLLHQPGGFGRSSEAYPYFGVPGTLWFLDRQSVLRNFSYLQAETDEGSAYTVHRYLSQGDQRTSGLWLLALLTFLPSFEGKCRDLTRGFIDLNAYCDDLGSTFWRFQEHLILSEITFEAAVSAQIECEGEWVRNIYKHHSEEPFAFLITVKRKDKMNNDTHFQTVIKAAIW
jgi:hypothetical protein